ncbi:hypothetical protein KFS96_004007 [Salmonella enterica]|nr:hypothetical protein [Salmonella enterica]
MGMVVMPAPQACPVGAAMAQKAVTAVVAAMAAMVVLAARVVWAVLV